MSTSNRELELAILEAALSQGRSRDFKILGKKLGLQPYHRDVLIEVVQATRWRGSEKPFEKVAAAVLRKVIRQDEVRPPRNEMLAPNQTVELLQAFRDSESYRDPGTGTWRGGRCSDRDHELPNWYSREEMLSQLPAAMKKTVRKGVDLVQEIDLSAVAELSGFDTWEISAIRWWAGGYSEKSAMAQWQRPEDKRAVRAAFHRLSRTGIARIQATIKIS